MSSIYLLSPWCERKYFTAQNSLLYLKYYMSDHGYKAEIIDCSHYDEGYDEVVRRIKESKRPIIGVTAYTRERFHAYRLIRRVKKEIPDSLIVAGGRHFGFLAEETLRELPEVDVVVRGEGEITMKEICDVVHEDMDLGDVLGISFRHEGKIQHNPDRPLADDLDKFRCFDIKDREECIREKLIGKSKIDAKREYFSVMATRGCPNRCVYCSQTASKVRYRSIESIIREIEEKIEVTGIRNVAFADSSLTINRHFVEDLCNRILERDLNIRFNCYSRVNINPDLLEIMKKAGLISVEIGLETGSPEILKSIRKNIRVDEFRGFCKMAYNLGIKIYVFCMISLPDEKKEDVDMTISLIKELSKYIYYIGLQTTRMLPDAALYPMAKERGLLSEDFSWFKPYEIPDEYKAISKDPYYDSIPLYIEHLTVEDIEQKIDEFKNIMQSRLSSMDILKKAILYNLSREGLRQLTLRKLYKKMNALLLMTFYALKNKKKEMNYK